MLVVVAYDVNTQDAAGSRRLRRVAKACIGKGQRVQSSVFECFVNNADYISLKHELESIIDPEKDSLRFYNLGNNYQKRISMSGKDSSYNPEDLLLL